MQPPRPRRPARASVTRAEGPGLDQGCQQSECAQHHRHGGTVEQHPERYRNHGAATENERVGDRWDRRNLQRQVEGHTGDEPQDAQHEHGHRPTNRQSGDAGDDVQPAGNFLERLGIPVALVLPTREGTARIGCGGGRVGERAQSPDLPDFGRARSLKGVHAGRFECRAHFTGPLVALHALLGETASDNGLETSWQRRGERERGVPQDRRDGLRRRCAGERQAARGHAAHQHPERPDIAAFVRGVASEHLGCHVRKGPGDQLVCRPGDDIGRGRSRALGVRDALRETEIEHLRFATRVEHDVGRLEIPVNDASGVRVRQRVGNLGGITKQGVEAQPEAVPAEMLAERAALEILHDDEGLSIVDAHVVDGADVPVFERRRRARFALEPSMIFGAVPLVHPNHLDGD